MKIVVSGSTGLVGSKLVPALAADGHEVARLVRAELVDTSDVRWDPAAGTIEAAKLAGVEAAVHLAGESIATGRWNAAKKARIKESREKGTRLLATTLADVSPTPKVLVSASAVGYYGDRGDERLTEDSPPGAMFLTGVCWAWEAATQPAVEKGIRVVNLRFGVILSARGGALARMLPPFRLGLGGRVGSGRQYLSWITVDDAVGVIRHALTTNSLQGPVNTASPNPVTNAGFTKTLGKVLGRPTVFPLPAFAARLVFGEMADELLLASARMDAGKLTGSGYEFQQPKLEGALRRVLGK